MSLSIVKYEDSKFRRIVLKKSRIIIVEDDKSAAKLTQDFLIESGFEVDAFHTGIDAVSNLEQNDYDLLLLDINLPDYDGFEILKSMKNKIAIPTIMLSANIQVDYKLKSFMLGAIDYMTKPFDLEELEGRIWLALNKPDKLNIDSSIFEIKGTGIYFKSNYLQLTKIEFELLKTLIANKNDVVSRAALAESLSSISSQRSLDYHIKNIRRKIKFYDPETNYIQTEYSLGYILKVS